MTKPIVYSDNILRRAQEGDDGTAYAAGTAATEIDANTIGTGALTLAADVPTAATLVGTGVEFDTTKNKYVITDMKLAMEAVGNALDLASGEDNCRCVIISGNYLYAGLQLSPSKIARINLATFQQDGTTITLAAGENTLSCMAISGNYLYVGLYLSPSKIARINLTTFLQDGTTVTLAGGEDTIFSMAVSGNYLYAGLQLSPSKIARINLSTFLQDGTTVTLAGGENSLYSLAVSGNYLYAGLQLSPSKIARINISTFLQDGTTVTLAGGENTLTCLAISGNYLYAGLGLSPSKIARINLTTFLQDGTTVTLAGGEDDIRTLVSSGDYLYAGLHLSPSKIARIKISTFLQDGTTVTLAAGVNNCYSLAVSGNYLYAGLGDLTPSKVAKVRALAEVHTFERFQTADLGDSFTIRAGLTCAQQDTSRVAPYAADTSLSPVFKGLTNTALYLRGHLPNFLVDGGFESGAFSPNWAAEATNPWVIESTTELEGAYSASWDLVASKYLRQSGTELLKKGVTYRLIYKAKSVTANPTAGAITVNLFQATSGTAVDGDAAGTTPAITTSSTWFAQDFVPDFDTDSWYLNIAGDSTKANGATEITMDEFYLYKKPTVNTLIIGRHNLVGKASLVVRAYKCSPLRSTIGADDYTEIKAAFTVDTADTYAAALTESYDPIYQLEIPATASFIPEIGELFIGNNWSLPYYPKGPFDPYKINADGLREIAMTFDSLAPALRTTTIKDFLEQARAGESWWYKWGSDVPVLMETPRGAQEAAYNPYRVNLTINGIEKT